MPGIYYVFNKCYCCYSYLLLGRTLNTRIIKKSAVDVVGRASDKEFKQVLSSQLALTSGLLHLLGQL